MDPESPVSRVGRTFWTVWNYITEAVNRFLRPELINTDSNGPNSTQQSTVDNESVDSGHPGSDTGGGPVNEEQPPATASLVCLSRSVVAWELGTTEIDLGHEEERQQYRSQLSGGRESKSSEEGEDMRKEQFSQTRNDAGLIVAKGARAKDEDGENGDCKEETQENDEYEEHAKMGSLNLTEDAMSEDIEVTGTNAGADDETQEVLDDHQKMDETMRKNQVKEEDDERLEAEITLCPKTEGSKLEEELLMHIEEARVQVDEVDTAVIHTEVENSSAALQLALENENENDEGAKPSGNQFSYCEELSENDSGCKGDPGVTSLEDELQNSSKESPSVSEDAGQHPVMAHRSERDEVEDEREKFESTMDERGQSEEKNVNRDADNQTIDEEPEQEEDIKTISEDSEDNFNEHVTCNEDAVQSVETELHTPDFIDGEKEDEALNTEVQTKTGETDAVSCTVIYEKCHVTTTDISVEEKFSDEDQVEEKVSTEKEEDKENYMKIACTTTSVTVKPEGETGEEISREFKNILQGICEGPVVASQGLNSLTCEETQEGLPEYNNEPGPDENTPQRFLEGGDSTEIHAIELPEEVESTEPQSLENSDAGGDYLMLREHMEEEQENIDSIKKEPTGILHLTDTGLPQETEKLLVELITEESGHLFEERDRKLSDSSLKMGIEHSEKEFETRVGLTDESDKINFVQESVDTMNFEQNSNMAPGLLEDISEFEFMKESVETEPKLFEDGTVEMQDAGIDMEEAGYGVEEDREEDEMPNNNEMEILNPEVVRIASYLTTENTTNLLFGESELSKPEESLEAKNQLSDEAFERSNEEMLKDTKLGDELMTIESRPKDLILTTTTEMAMCVTESEGSYAEETSSSVSGCQDVIDEEILDLWIQTALLKDANDMEQQEESEPGLQMDTKTEPSNDKQDDMALVQAEKDQLVESNSGESGLLSDIEISSSTAESGFLEKSISEWGTDESDTHLLKSTSTGSFQGIYDTFASIESAEISELSTQQPNSESQDLLMEETGQSHLTEEESIAEIGFHPDSGVISSEAGHLNQELDKLEVKTDERFESVATETESQEEIDVDVMNLADPRTDWKNNEEADIEAKIDSLFIEEKTKGKDVPLEVTVSDSPLEIKHAESVPSTSGSEALLQEEIMLTESEVDAYTESEKLLKMPSLDKLQPGWSEDIGESLYEMNRTDVAAQLTTKSEEQTEVDASALDFTAQRARIAVKNPHVRPPKDPRALLNMPSVDPTPSSHLPVRLPAGVPLGGMGIGIKLPGLGAGFPVLKKTRVVKEEKSTETLSQGPETKPEEKSDTSKQDEAQHKPKWMPPRHPGFGNPLMSELKTRLKKTTEE